MMLKAICLGRIKYDINVLIDKQPIEGSTIEVFNKIGCGGGTATNVAVAFGKWGIGCAVCGVLGNDVYGNKIKEEFDKVHLDMRYIEQSYSNDTPLSTIIINNETKKYTIYNLSDKFVSIKKMDFDFSPDITVVDGYDSVSSKKLLERFPNSKRILCANIISKEVFELCHKAQYVICPINFAELMSGVKYDPNNVKSLAQIYQAVKKKNLNTEFIIYLEEKGALYCVNNQVKISPMIQMEVQDNQGGFDAFCAGFSYIIAIDNDIEKGVKYGCISASLNSRTIGTRLSIPTIEEIKKVYEQNY